MTHQVATRNIALSLLLCLATVAPLAQAADDDPIRMIIKQYDRDLYSTMDDLLYIRTHQCLEPAYSENAILFYIPYSDDNKLQFSSKVECKVLELYDRGAHYSKEGR
ncbi:MULTISPECIES: hypothetical protein [unclassified Pseudomonas]|uniref:hypothetical protein n=1 Tax=unclassified Pseudomonas TaxID=196821 RepID=UPI00244C54CE|nr:MULTISPECIES: hypothetical protein [unclassified Pseudomonas]MDG9929991.1 hypothetical protein [Pseudomonas sp. GD04042]MDH0483221.1 hypothetical protein [Pseudomonas sp. GD04015]MDH0606318.1 hypothetical protein [Pseudomonas sp. GD03869]